MADTKISALTQLTAPATGDWIPIVDTSAGVTKKIDWDFFVPAEVFELGSSYATLQDAATARKTLGLVGSVLHSSVALNHEASYNFRLFTQVPNFGTYPNAGVADLSDVEGQVVAFEDTTVLGSYRLGYVFWDTWMESWSILSKYPHQFASGAGTYNLYKPIWAEIRVPSGYEYAYDAAVGTPASLGDISFTSISAVRNTTRIALVSASSSPFLEFSGTDVRISGLNLEYAPGAGSDKTTSTTGLNFNALKEGQFVGISDLDMTGGWSDALYGLNAKGQVNVSDCDLIGAYDVIRLAIPAEANIYNNRLKAWQGHRGENGQEITCVAIGNPGPLANANSRIIITNNQMSCNIDGFDNSDASWDITGAGANVMRAIDLRNYFSANTTIIVDNNTFDLDYASNNVSNTLNGKEVAAISVNNVSSSQAGGAVYATNNKLTLKVPSTNDGLNSFFINNRASSNVTVYRRDNVQVGGATLTASVNSTALSEMT